MDRFLVGDMVVITQNEAGFNLKGEEGEVILPLNVYFGTCHNPLCAGEHRIHGYVIRLVRDGRSVLCTEAVLRHRYDGNTPVKWEECGWQPDFLVCHLAQHTSHTLTELLGAD